MNLRDIAESNKLLAKEEAVAIYDIMYYASIDNKKMTVQEIMEDVKDKHSCDLTYKQVWTVLEALCKSDVMRKHIKKGTNRYYLHKRIQNVSGFAPVHNYQLILLFASFMCFAYSIVVESHLLPMFFSSFVTILTIVIVHYLVFEAIRSDILRRVKALIRSVYNPFSIKSSYKNIFEKE